MWFTKYAERFGSFLFWIYFSSPEQMAQVSKEKRGLYYFMIDMVLYFMLVYLFKLFRTELLSLFRHLVTSKLHEQFFLCLIFRNLCNIESIKQNEHWGTMKYSSIKIHVLVCISNLFFWKLKKMNLHTLQIYLQI